MTTRAFAFANLIGGDNKISVESLPSEATEKSTASFESADALPLSGNNVGDQAFVQSTNRLYIWNGSGWYNIALINTNPTITGGVNDSYTLQYSTPLVISMVASDPEELALSYSYELISGSPDLATITNTDNLFTVTPTSNYEIQGSFTVAFKASDGINIATKNVTFSLTNQEPSNITGMASTYELSTEGNPTIITLNSIDPEGLDLQWGYQVTSGSLTNNGGTTATITQQDNVFTITPTVNEDYAGQFSLTFTATDGVNTVSEISDFTLQFAISYPLLTDLTYSSTVSTTNVAGASGFNLGYTYGFNTTPDGRWASIGGEYGPAIWEFTTPGTLSTLTKRYSSAIPPNINGNGGGGGTAWKPDGSKIYYAYQASGTFRFLSWNWNGTSLSGGTTAKTINMPSGWSTSRSIRSMCFNSDGTSVFIVGTAIGSVYKYTLTTPYELSSISASPAQTKSINWASDVVISPDDTYICWREGEGNTWKQYIFNSPLNLSNVTLLATKSFPNSGGTTTETSPIGLRFKLDGSGVLIFDKQNDQIDEYVI